MAASSREQIFSRLFHVTAEKYWQARQNSEGLLSDEEKEFLSSIGYTEKEFFEFIEDFVGITENSVFWLRKSAQAGDIMDQNTLGYIYTNGMGVPQDYAEAIVWYRKAAERGDVGAQTGLGYLYGCGLGTKRDFAEAARWHRKAAENGSDYSQVQLAFQYARAQGVPKDPEEAVFWFRKAADLGNVEAVEELKKRGLVT